MKKKNVAVLTPLQEKFIIEYVKEIGDAYSKSRRPSAQDAAIKAGYSPKTAHNMASRMLRNERIKANIDAEIQNILKSSREEVRYKLIERLNITGFSDVSLFVDENNNVLPKSQWPKGASVAVQEVVNVPTPNGMRTEIKLKDDKKSQDLLIKLLMLTEDKPQKIELDISLTSQEEQDAKLKELLSKME